MPPTSFAARSKPWELRKEGRKEGRKEERKEGREGGGGEG